MKNYAWFTLIIPRYSLFYWIKTRLPTTPNLPQQPKSGPNWDRFTATKNSPFSESSCVPKEGLEPSWDCSHHALNVARLPIPPLRLDLLRVEFYLKDGFCQLELLSGVYRFTFYTPLMVLLLQSVAILFCGFDDQVIWQTLAPLF